MSTCSENSHLEFRPLSNSLGRKWTVPLRNPSPSPSGCWLTTKKQEFPKSVFCTLPAVVRFVVLGGVISVSIPASLGNAQIKIAKAAEMMPESKYSYRATKGVRWFGEIVTHRADISYYLCSNMKGKRLPPAAAGKTSKSRMAHRCRS